MDFRHLFILLFPLVPLILPLLCTNYDEFVDFTSTEEYPFQWKFLLANKIQQT